MSKEMTIVFVYDREKCQQETDDPISAVSYFHPSWVSDIQKLALCGQLMGVSHFLDLNFKQAKMISLQSGKFILKDFGRFVLTVGTDRNISDSVLEHRAELLSSFVKLYHRDLETVYEQCIANNGSYKTVADKFYHMFETYLPILQYNGSIFQNVSTLKIPPSANCVFVESMQILQGFRALQGVLGGTILYHNKIISTQLSPNLSKKLVLTDPYRIKTTAETISVKFHVPIGVQLIAAYIPLTEYLKMKNDASRAQNLVNAIGQSSGILPFQVKRKIKRDKSLFFSNIPEEEAVNPTNVVVENGANGVLGKPPSKPRPNHLPLKMKIETTRDVPESGFNSINFDESDSFPQFIGKTSICSTPLLENKVLHGNFLSICVNQNGAQANGVAKEEKAEKNNKYDVQELPGSNFNNNIRENKFKSFPRSLSVRPLTNFSEMFSKTEEEIVEIKARYQTITDPNFPVFNNDGLPISKYFFDECSNVEVGIDIAQELEDLNIDGFGYEDELQDKTEPVTEEVKSSPVKISNGSVKTEHTTIPETNGIEVKLRNLSKENNDIKRRSLTLPVKSLNLDPDSKLQENYPEPTNGEQFTKRIRPDFPVTPLMSKIMSQLPMDGWSSGFSSCAMTPVMTPIDVAKSFARRKSSISKIEEDSEKTVEDEKYGQKVDLIICGHQNMTMLMMLEEGSCQKQEFVQSIWEACISRLPKIEANLQQTLNVNVDGVVDKNDVNYSFICMDPHYDIVHRGGPWTMDELQILEDLYSDFNGNPSFTEAIVRCEESVIYGYSCGDAQIFYKQPANSYRGLPAPADSMGNAPINARRRLERHSVILL